MKILMLTPYLPYPPSSGGQIRSYNLIKQLSKKHQITLCSLVKSKSEEKYVEKLTPFCQKVYIFKRPEKPWTLSNIIRTGFSLFPFLVIRNFSPQEKLKLRQIIDNERFDIIHAETFYVYPHIPTVQTPVVLVDQTIEYQVYKHYVDHYWLPPLKPLLYLDVFKMKYWETYYWKKASRVIAVSEKDGEIMREEVKRPVVRIVPNGVGEDLMEDTPSHFNETILFIGNYLWLQNVEAARILAKDVFPLVLKKVPKAQLLIAGQYTAKIASLSSEGISIEDLAVDDVAAIRKVYKSSGVLVAPLYGPGGTRLKILAAMAAKLPVITTKVGIAGVGKPGVSFLHGETINELANLTIKVLQDQKLYQKIAENARKLVEQNYAYPAIAKKLDEIYREVRAD